MKFYASVPLLALVAAASAHEAHIPARLAHRQVLAASAPASAPASTPVPSATGAATGTGTATGAAPTTPPAAAAPAGTPGTAVPPLSLITSGMPTEATLPVTATYAAGATPPIKGAPPLPTPFVFTISDWPQQDVIPPTNSSEVAEWLTELDGWNIPNIQPTIDGSCADDPVSVSQAAQRGWWTCGGYTRSTDIVACPDKDTWGVSFDDGPSDYTQTLLEYLDSKSLKATFFVVGSRVVQNPQILVEEYMSGHEISVHTWSHHYLTTMTNEQIVAELGYTRKAIKAVLGITPTTMRPPYGDIDDRVRAISLAMGLVPIIWTATPDGNKFDTNDWRVAGGQMTGLAQFDSFQQLLGNASVLNTGFIVLQHDLFEITVDLARGYTINAALTHNPPFNLQSIGTCQHWPATDLYRETTTNTTFPYTNGTSSAGGANGTSSGSGAQASGGAGAASGSGSGISGALGVRVPAALSLALGVAGAAFLAVSL